MGSYQMVDVGQVEARNGIFRALTDQLGVAGFRINQLELAAAQRGLSTITLGTIRKRCTRWSRAAAYFGQAEKRFRCAPATLFISRRMCADRWWQATRG